MNLIENIRYSVDQNSHDHTSIYSCVPNSYDERVLFYIENCGFEIDKTTTIVSSEMLGIYNHSEAIVRHL